MKFSIEIELRNAPIEVLDDIVKTLSVWGEDMTIVKFNSQDQAIKDLEEEQIKYIRQQQNVMQGGLDMIDVSKLKKPIKNESPDILGLTITEPEEIKPNDK